MSLKVLILGLGLLVLTGCGHHSTQPTISQPTTSQPIVTIPPTTTPPSQSPATSPPVTTPPVSTPPPVVPPPPPMSTTGDITVFWTAPTLNTDGTPCINLAGYYLYYSTSAAMTSPMQIKIDNPGITAFVVTGLTLGITYYFDMQAYNSVGGVSAYSNIASGEPSDSN